MLRAHEAEDVLRLLSVVGQGVGAKNLAEEYETPREGWAAKVEEMGWVPGDAAAERLARVQAFLAVAEA